MTKLTFRATPLAMTHKFFQDSFGRGDVGAESDYEVRQTVEVEANNRIGACEQAWQVFQNVHDDWLCPDGKRSLMVGDIVKLESTDDDEGPVTYHRVASLGWERLKGFAQPAGGEGEDANTVWVDNSAA